MTVNKELWLGLDGLYQVLSENVVNDETFFTLLFPIEKAALQGKI